ncbi:MAG: FlgD immunoglobulin-like domain containing protein [bacterium]
MGNNGQHPVLQWDANTEPDLDHYTVYRGYNNLETGEIIWNSVATPTNTTWVDNDVTINTSSQTVFRYKTTAVDDASNESDYSNTVFTNGYFVPEITTEPVAETNLPQPKAIALQQNYPNPFNPITEIRFELPNAVQISLKIYNLLGEEIRTLVKRNMEAGFHAVKWNGKNNLGREVASGVYIYRMEVQSQDSEAVFSQMRKMTLLR